MKSAIAILVQPASTETELFFPKEEACKTVTFIKHAHLEMDTVLLKHNTP